jgi:hypothetical protein
MLAHEDRRNQTRAQLNTDYSDRLLERDRPGMEALPKHWGFHPGT